MRSLKRFKGASFGRASSPTPKEWGVTITAFKNATFHKVEGVRRKRENLHVAGREKA